MVVAEGKCDYYLDHDAKHEPLVGSFGWSLALPIRDKCNNGRSKCDLDGVEDARWRLMEETERVKKLR